MIQGHSRVLGGSLITETGRACRDPSPDREQVCGADAQFGAGQQDRVPLCSQAWPQSSSVAR